MLRRDANMLHALLKKTSPSVHRHLEKHNVEPLLYVKNSFVFLIFNRIRFKFQPKRMTNYFFLSLSLDDRLVLVCNDTNTAVGHTFAHLGLFLVRRHQSHIQSGASDSGRLFGISKSAKTMQRHVRNDRRSTITASQIS